MLQIVARLLCLRISEPMHLAATAHQQSTCLTHNQKLHPSYAHQEALSKIPTSTSKFNRALPYIPNNVHYGPTDLYTRLFANSIDIKLTHIIDAGRRDIRMPAVLSLSCRTKLSKNSAIYCGNMLGSGILGDVKEIHGEWAIVEVRFWSILRSEEAYMEGVEEDISLDYDIVFPRQSLRIPRAVRHAKERHSQTTKFQPLVAIDQISAPI